MVRAAAKNYSNVTVITNISQYENLIKNIEANKGATSTEFRKQVALEAFGETAYYESLIYNYFNQFCKNEFPRKMVIGFNLNEKLRYGENPHQSGSIYTLSKNLGLEKLNGKHLSYNNYADIFSAIQISRTFPKRRGTVIVKHGNPCGVSIHKNNSESFKMAYECDPLSAFGGIISCNFKINKKIAIELNKIFFEVIIADEFDKDALYILKKKKNVRLIRSKNYKISNKNHLISNMNFVLAQNPDIKSFKFSDFKVVSKIKPSKKTFENLIFAFNVCRFVKSNAIVLTSENSTVGIGSGQPSRLDSCEIAVNKMKKFNHNTENLVAASDATEAETTAIWLFIWERIRALSVSAALCWLSEAIRIFLMLSLLGKNPSRKIPMLLPETPETEVSLWSAVARPPEAAESTVSIKLSRANTACSKLLAVIVLNLLLSTGRFWAPSSWAPTPKTKEQHANQGTTYNRKKAPVGNEVLMSGPKYKKGGYKMGYRRRGGRK